MNLPISKESDAKFSAERKQLPLSASHNRVVVALIHTGFDISILFADIDELLHFGGSVVREPETLELALLEGVVHGLRHVFKGRLTIRDVQEHSVHARRLEFFKRSPNAQSDFGWFMGSGTSAEDFRVDGKSRGSIGPAEAFLGAWVVGGRVDFSIAPIVECVQEGIDLFFVVEMDNSRMLGSVADLVFGLE